MRIGILTQPLHTNYGGLLQGFALQRTLTIMGHDVRIVDLPFRPKSNMRLMKIIASRIVRKYLLKQTVNQIMPHTPTNEQMGMIAMHTNRFIRENIKTTERIPSVKELDKLKKYQFQAYIVGSDQVWRPVYSPGMPSFFLDFVKDNEKVKRIAYAASFGVDHWEFSQRLTRKCKKLAQKFDAISVREASAISLCKEYLGSDATHVLDPTLLLDKEEYIALVEKDKIAPKPKSLMLYVLDQADDKMAIARKVETKLGLKINQVMPKKRFEKENTTNLDECVYPPVTEWIRGFMDAEFVVTDSFHGTVFAIIFNKPFIAIGNQGRGLSRFSSLLKILELEDRLISTTDQVTTQLIRGDIDYGRLNEKIREERERSLAFISSAIA
ncbi:MAG: polysaccharide pyruvyl transferase family protein [Bacteroidales bacterium]|nr:polysaccharide pyruvyl transferase family protein [Bacteroidales bacterium]